MAFAERLHSSVGTSSLASNDNKLMPVDYVASLSGASSLGSDIMRSSDYDPSALRRVLINLQSKGMKDLKLKQGTAFNVAFASMKELLHWQCRNCDSAGQVIEGTLKIVCTDCGGNGVHRWSDHERAKAAHINVKKWHEFEKAYLVILDLARIDLANTPGLSKKRMGY